MISTFFLAKNVIFVVFLFFFHIDSYLAYASFWDLSLLMVLRMVFFFTMSVLIY